MAPNHQYQISEAAWNHYIHSREAYGTLTRQEEAALFAQCVQLQFLNDPVHSVFPQPRQMLVSDLGNGRFCVRGYVDTPSPYGAMTRIDFTHFVQQDPTYRWHYAPLTPDISDNDAAQIAGAVAVSVAIPIIIWIILVVVIFVGFFALFPLLI